jgi:exosome complex RNA-binding protein Rrp4
MSRRVLSEQETTTMPEKVVITISVSVSENGRVWNDQPEGEAEAAYTLPDQQNLPSPDIAVLIQTAYDQYKAACAAQEAEEMETE